MKRGVLVALLVAIAIALSACDGYTDPATNVTSASATLRGHVSCEEYDGSGMWWWEYRKNGGPWQQTSHTPFNCTSNVSNAPVSKNLTGLTPDSHYDFVIAGYQDSDPDQIRWYGGHTYFDTSRRPPFDGFDTDPPPNTSITSGPSGFTNSASATFGFSPSPSGAPSFECRLDGSGGGTWQSCSSPKSYSALADGSHTFEVRAKDAAGTADPSPASRSWTIDTTGPTIQLSGPLKDAADLGEPLTESSYGLTVTSTDGPSSSGVKDIETLVDGESVGLVEQACQQGSCSMWFDWTLDRSGLSGGVHLVTVVVQDQLGQQSEQSFTVTVSPEPFVPDTLPCTAPDEPTNFQTYSLGLAFEALPFADVLRRCEDPYPGEPVRANSVSYIYGTCVPAVTQEGGCAPPLEIQTWPACERALSDYELEPGVPYPHVDLGELRGVPAYSFEEELRVELYTGDSTVVIFGLDAPQVLRAIAAIRPTPASLPPTVPPLLEPDSFDDLPAPVSGAMSGELSCGA